LRLSLSHGFDEVWSDKMERPLAKKILALAAVLIQSAGMAIGPSVSQAAGKSQAYSNRFDPCVLVSSADVQAVLGKIVNHVVSDDDGESRKCEYSTADKNLLIHVFTGKKELSEFQADSKGAAERDAGLGDRVIVKGIAVPAYPNMGEGRLVVWKNKIAVTIEILDTASVNGPETVEPAREKLANIAVSRMN
jgi:hypothetical protein